MPIFFKKNKIKFPQKRKQKLFFSLPLLVERDEDGYYIIECPLFSGCFTQGKTLDEALKNIREVIELCLEEDDNRQRLYGHHPQEISFHTINMQL